jgi:hypothetical protein
VTTRQILQGAPAATVEAIYNGLGLSQVFNYYNKPTAIRAILEGCANSASYLSPAEREEAVQLATLANNPRLFVARAFGHHRFKEFGFHELYPEGHLKHGPNVPGSWWLALASKEDASDSYGIS